MKVPEEFKKDVAEKIGTAIGPSHECPMCKKADELLISEDIFHLSEFHGVGKQNSPGKIMPLVILSCNNCGYVMNFNAITLGVVDAEEDSV